MEEKTTMEITNDRLEEAIKDYAADKWVHLRKSNTEPIIRNC